MALDNNQGKGNAFDPKTNEPITAKQRLDKLIQDNYKFDACISQPPVIDSIALAILFIVSENKTSIKKEKEKTIDKLTLDDIVDILDKHKLIKTPVIEEIKGYKKKRIAIIHRTVGGEITVNFLEFYKLGKQIIIEGLLAWSEVKKLERHLLACDRCREIVDVIRDIIDHEEG